MNEIKVTSSGEKIAAREAYQKPKITTLGSVAKLTMAPGSANTAVNRARHRD